MKEVSPTLSTRQSQQQEIHCQDADGEGGKEEDDPIAKHRLNMDDHFFLRSFRGDGSWGGDADFGSFARWPIAALNRAAADPSLKSSGPRCGLPRDEVDFGAMNCSIPLHGRTAIGYLITRWTF